MAEITAPATASKKGGRRSKKLSTRVDLTPMVDLGFLLITFFIFTTTMSDKKVTRLMLPADGDPTQVAVSTALTIIPTSHDVFFYYGDWQNAMAPGAHGSTGYSVHSGIGEVIRKKQSAMERYKTGHGKDLMVIIKPDSSASYKQVVSVLDEMLINEVGRYTLTDISEIEAKYVKNERAEK